MENYRFSSHACDKIMRTTFLLFSYLHFLLHSKSLSLFLACYTSLLFIGSSFTLLFCSPDLSTRRAYFILGGLSQLLFWCGEIILQDNVISHDSGFLHPISFHLYNRNYIYFSVDTFLILCVITLLG